MNRRHALLAALLLGTVATPAAAQAHREGWWAEASGGYGYLRVGTAADEVQRTTGASFYVRAGYQIAHNVSFGLEATRFYASVDTANVYVDGATFIVLFNPSSHLPLYLHGGVGISDGRLIVDVPVQQKFAAQGTGVGLSFGAAYDIRVGRHLAITPAVQTHIAALGDFHFTPTTVANDVIATAYQVGVGITWR